MVIRNLPDCDCMSCKIEKREENMTTTHLTCTCTARFIMSMDAEHDSDCDLWLLDEFWACFVAWDPERECLVPTDAYPNDGDSNPYVPTPLDDIEWDEHDLVQQKLGEMDQRDKDIALTTDMFIERMMNKMPEDDGKVWTQDDNGVWKASPATPHPSQASLKGGYSYISGYGDDDFDWNNYTLTDRHAGTPCVFTNGVQVRGTSLSRAHETDIPDFALYLDGGWRPDGMAIMLPWRDYGLPSVSLGFAEYAIREAYTWAEAGAVVEIGCIGAHGRTGTVMACMAILADPTLTPEAAVWYVRGAYCQHAVETREQEWFVAWFHAKVHDLPEPPKPVYVPAKPIVTTTQVVTTDPKAGTSPAAGRTTKNRRSKRGGRRHQRHRNRMKQGSRK